MENAELTLILVMPPQPGLLNGFATGLISIANYVQDQLPAVRVQLLDLSTTHLSSLEPTILHKGLSFAKNTVVGITTTTASYQSALGVASAFKKLTVRGVKFTTVLGGHHVSADTEVVLQNHAPEEVDYIVVGEGEIAMTEFLRRFPNVCSTPGLAFKHNDLIQMNPSAPLLVERELDTIPITFKERGFLGTPGKFGHVTYVSARGCPLKCAFCSVANQKIRARSVPRVVEDIRRLVDLNFSRIAIEDNFFAHAPKRTSELCEALAALRRKGLKFTWDCQTRIESMDRAGLVPLMERAGCEAVYLGVESLNLDQLTYLNKTPNPERYLDRLRQRVVPALLESDIECFINLQFGLPGENKKHHEVTKAFLKDLGLEAARRNKRITIFPMLHVVYPSTEHFFSGLRQQKFPRDIFETFTFWESRQTPVLNWLGKHFAHGTGGIPIGILNSEVLRSGVFEMQDREIIKFGAVMQIDSILTDLDGLEGIRVFKYGSHLVPTEEPDQSPIVLEAANN
jgi:radical SAM superfamily enzyme YgiQ (UPF0313 family)